MTQDFEPYFHDVFSNEDIKSLTNEKGVINYNIRIRDSKTHKDFSSIENVTKINGDLFIQSKQLKNSGSLIYINGSLTISESPNFKNLENLERIENNAILRYSSITSTGNLEYIGGKLSLRDTPIISIGKIRHVGNDLFLPKRLEEELNKKITVKGKTRFWNDLNSSKISEINNLNDWGCNHNILFSDIHQIELDKKQRSLNGEFLIKKCYKPSQLNQYIIENKGEYYEFVDKKIEELYSGNYSFFYVLFNEKIDAKKINIQFPQIKIDKRKIIKNNIIKKQASDIINQNKSPFKKYTLVLKEFKKTYNFSGNTSKYYIDYKSHKLSLTEFTGLTKTSFIYFIENIILEIFSVFINDSQNEFRVSKGLPKIGEGWVSETELYNKLNERFPNEKIIHHGKPKWLGRQHVDIWFPKYKIGVEFQGKQHYEPVEYFGGKEAFEKNILRDLKKKKLFIENNSILIEVTHGYNLEKLISEIKTKIY